MPSRTTTSEREDGFTLVEVLVAAFLLLGGFALLVNTVVSMNSATRRNAQRDLATTVAFSYLEELKARGCGIATGGETLAELQAMRGRCDARLGFGNAEESYFDRDGNPISRALYDVQPDAVRLQSWTSWALASSSKEYGDDACTSVVSDPAANQYPDSVLRTVQTFGGPAGNKRRLKLYTVREAVSPDRVSSRPQSTGGYVITGLNPVGAARGLNVSVAYSLGDVDGDGDEDTVVRGNGGESCVWLPYLPASPNTELEFRVIDLEAGGVTLPSFTRTVSIAAGSTLVESCAVVIASPSCD